MPKTSPNRFFYNGGVNYLWANAGNWWSDIGHTIPAAVPVANDFVHLLIRPDDGPAAPIVFDGFIQEGAAYGPGISVNISIVAGGTLTMHGGIWSGTATAAGITITFSGTSENIGDLGGNAATFNDSACIKGGVFTGVITWHSGGVFTETGAALNLSGATINTDYPLTIEDTGTHGITTDSSTQISVMAKNLVIKVLGVASPGIKIVPTYDDAATGAAAQLVTDKGHVVDHVADIRKPVVVIPGGAAGTLDVEASAVSVVRLGRR